MKNTFILFILSCSWLLTSQAQDNQIALDKVVVVGTIPGPDLWMVTNGDNTLWILGTQTPLPKKMQWESQPVETTIKESQALLLSPGVSLTTKIGFFQKLSLIPSVIGMKKNPDKQKLKDILPADLYQRWSVLKKQYLGKGKAVEKTRPIFAAYKLYDKAISKSGLTENNNVNKKIRKVAKRNKLEIIKPLVLLDIKKPKNAIKKFKKSTINDLECFTKTLERVEQDIPAMLIRAQAWASGDITHIKSLKYPDHDKACGEALLNSEIAEDTGVEDLVEKLKNKWLEHAQKALQEHSSTFAILPMRQLVGENSYLTGLTAMGYNVIEPK